MLDSWAVKWEMKDEGLIELESKRGRRNWERELSWKWKRLRSEVGNEG